MQLQAGYIFDFVKKRLLEDNDSSEVNDMLDYLALFETDVDFSLEFNDKPELAAIRNLLHRGLPTRPSLFIEEVIVKILQVGDIHADVLGNVITGYSGLS